jgi:hypothetical protein
MKVKKEKKIQKNEIIKSIIPNSLNFDLDSLLKNFNNSSKEKNNLKIEEPKSKCKFIISSSTCSSISSMNSQGGDDFYKSGSCYVLNEIKLQPENFIKEDEMKNYSLLSSLSKNQKNEEQNTNNNNNLKVPSFSFISNGLSKDTNKLKNSSRFTLNSRSISRFENSVVKSQNFKVDASTSMLKLDEKKIYFDNSTQTNCVLDSNENDFFIEILKLSPSNSITNILSQSTIDKNSKLLKNPSNHSISSSLSSLSLYEKEFYTLQKESISEDFKINENLNRQKELVDSSSQCLSELLNDKFYKNPGYNFHETSKNTPKNITLKPIKMSNTFKLVPNPFFDRVLNFENENKNELNNSKPASTTSILSSAYSFDSITSSQKLILKNSLKKAKNSGNNEKVISNLGIEVISLLQENLIKKSKSKNSSLKTNYVEEKKHIYPPQISSSDTPMIKPKQNKNKVFDRKFSLQENSKT